MRNVSSAMSMVLIGILCIGGFQIVNAQNVHQVNIQPIQQIGKSISSFQYQEKTTSHYPPDFQVDDLVFFDSTFRPGRWNVPGLDHVAIYLGNDTFVCTGHSKQTGTFGVNIMSYDSLFTSGMLINPRYARVINATAEQRHAATEWALSRIGDLYQTWDPRKCADPNSRMITANQWYCSEIVWAAYYNQGIDIDKNGWKRDFPSFFPIFSAVSPQDIFDDNDVVHFS